MKNTVLGLALCLATILPGTARADCGEVSITEMNWASAQVVTAVASFIMEHGYGCEVSKVNSDTVPAMASVAENGNPDIVTELWLNSAGEAYTRLEKQGKLKRVGKVLEPGGVEGWWIPAYLAAKHPELKTLEGVLAHPEWVGGVFNNCPDGWGCRIVNDNLIRAIDLESHGIEVFNHGSGETLATSIASAYGNKQPWLGYYWGPTPVLGTYDMVRVDLGDYDEDVHETNQNSDTPSPELSDFPAAPVITAVTSDFADREPDIATLMSKMSYDVDVMSELVAWKQEHNASVEETAVRFLTGYPRIWEAWLSPEAKKNLEFLLK